MIMGMGRKRSVLKMKRKKSQAKFKNRIKKRIAEKK
jgi:hypothetical protein